MYDRQKQLADQRDRIIFDEPYDTDAYPGGIRYFGRLTPEQIGQLDALGLLDHEDCQNDAPSVGEMIEFIRARESDGWYAHGYCISPERDDFRISFEGIGKTGSPTRQEAIDFASMFRWASILEMDDDGLRCWYD